MEYENQRVREVVIYKMCISFSIQSIPSPSYETYVPSTVVARKYPAARRSGLRIHSVTSEGHTKRGWTSSLQCEIPERRHYGTDTCIAHGIEVPKGQK